MNNSDKQLFDNMLKQSGGKLDKKAVEAAKSGDTSALMNNLSPEDKQKLNQILSDKNALSELLKSPEALAIMKMLKRGGKNG